MSDNYDGPQLAQKIIRQQAEIERLRGFAEYVTRDAEIFQAERLKAEAEVERLRQLLRNAGVPEWVLNNE